MQFAADIGCMLHNLFGRRTIYFTCCYLSNLTTVQIPDGQKFQYQASHCILLQAHHTVAICSLRHQDGRGRGVGI